MQYSVRVDISKEVVNLEYSSNFFDLFLHNESDAKRLKEAGHQFLGYVCTHVPEELIAAAGFTPYRMMGDTSPIDVPDLYLPPCVCTFARSMFSKVLRGSYNFLAGMVLPTSCDVIKEMGGVKDLVPFPFFHRVANPTRTDMPYVAKYYTAEAMRFKKALEDFTGQTITDTALSRINTLYDENRQLLQQIYRLRTQNPTLLTGVEFYDIIRAGMVISKERHNLMLKDFLAGAPQKRPELEERCRLLVSGGAVDNREILEIIENSGAIIAADDLCYGTRYFSGLTSREDDPLTALAKRYLQKVSCPCRHPVTGRLEAMKKQIAEASINGVIFVLQKFCATHFADQPFFKDELEKAGIPSLVLEVENTPTGMEAVRTRIQAFIETIHGRRV